MSGMQNRIHKLIGAACPALLMLSVCMNAWAGDDIASEWRVVDDFEAYPIGTFPGGWDWYEDEGHHDRPYVVAEEQGNKYLAARDQGQSIIIGKEVDIDLNRFPYLSFRWRVHRLPTAADERHGSTGDSAAAIYVVYRKKFGFIPQTVKYVWSSTLPAGSALRRSGTGRPWIIVADSGESELGSWQTHVFDVAAAWRETFGGKAQHRVIAIGVLSDANATGSEAHADYDDLRFLSRADADSGIRQIIEAD